MGKRTQTPERWRKKKPILLSLSKTNPHWEKQNMEGFRIPSGPTVPHHVSFMPKRCLHTFGTKVLPPGALCAFFWSVAFFWVGHESLYGGSKAANARAAADFLAGFMSRATSKTLETKRGWQVRLDWIKFFRKAVECKGSFSAAQTQIGQGENTGVLMVCMQSSSKKPIVSFYYAP